MSLVEVRQLTRRFGTMTAVDGIDFAFDRGEIFGFIGPNGAGKSTTMRILATLDLPSDGNCLVDGLSTVDDYDKVRRLIGFMPDHFGSYPSMTVWEYLDFFARSYALRGDARRRAVGSVMDFCQLDGLREKTVISLSKGMKQRLCLGRCLVHDPKLLILDEPSAGLDPRARIEFRELLRILADQGKGIFISSHILAELEELCQSVAIIELGKLVATGRIKDIKDRARQDAAAVAVASGGAHRLTVEIRVATDHPDIDRILAEQPDLSQVRREGRLVTAMIQGGEAELAALLKRLVAAGLPISHFGVREENLEDLFMTLTQGKVQ